MLDQRIHHHDRALPQCRGQKPIVCDVFQCTTIMEHARGKWLRWALRCDMRYCVCLVTHQQSYGTFQCLFVITVGFLVELL